MAFKLRHLVPLTLLVTLAGSASADALYRYEDDAGRMVWGATVPSHVVSKGYQEYDRFGRLVRQVDRTMSSEEEARRSQELVALARESEIKERQRRLDNLLMRRYSSLEDFESRRSLAMSTLEGRRSAAMKRLSDLEFEYAELGRSAAGNELKSAESNIQMSRKANLELLMDRMHQELNDIDGELREYQVQSDREYNRLTELLASS